MAIGREDKPPDIIYREFCVSKPTLSSEQVRAARALLRWEQKDLARESGISLPSIRRLETQPGLLAAYGRTIEAIRAAFEAAGLEFIEENGGGEGVRFRERRWG